MHVVYSTSLFSVALSRTDRTRTWPTCFVCASDELPRGLAYSTRDRERKEDTVVLLLFLSGRSTYVRRVQAGGDEVHIEPVQTTSPRWRVLPREVVDRACRPRCFLPLF